MSLTAWVLFVAVLIAAYTMLFESGSRSAKYNAVVIETAAP